MFFMEAAYEEAKPTELLDYLQYGEGNERLRRTQMVEVNL